MNSSLPPPASNADEHLIFTVPANWSQGGLARGGSLDLTNQRLLFRPNSVESAIGLGPPSWPRPSITGVSVARRGCNPFSGALRRRLRVEFADGTDALFVVSDVESVRRQLSTALGR